MSTEATKKTGKLEDKHKTMVAALGNFMIAAGNSLLTVETYEELQIVGHDRMKELDKIEELAKDLGVDDNEMELLVN